MHYLDWKQGVCLIYSSFLYPRQRVLVLLPIPSLVDWKWGLSKHLLLSTSLKRFQLEQHIYTENSPSRDVTLPPNTTYLRLSTKKLPTTKKSNIQLPTKIQLFSLSQELALRSKQKRGRMKTKIDNENNFDSDKVLHFDIARYSLLQCSGALW